MRNSGIVYINPRLGSGVLKSPSLEKKIYSLEGRSCLSSGVKVKISWQIVCLVKGEIVKSNLVEIGNLPFPSLQSLMTVKF